MTNSEQDKPSTTIGTPDQTSADEGAKYVSQRGTEFEIGQVNNGLYIIKMLKGGKVPPICDEMYTSRSEANRVLSLYLRRGDKLGYAKFPDKVKDGKG